jgi:aspartate ammonia-lyase
MNYLPQIEKNERRNFNTYRERSLGFREVPNQFYFGIQTLRAIENFNLSSNKIEQFPNIIKSLAMVKLACAQANNQLDKLDNTKLEAIKYACENL